MTLANLDLRVAGPSRAEHGNIIDTEKQMQNDEDEDERHLLWTKWIEERFDFSWFTCTQSTGGVAIVLSECPKQFDGLQRIGTIIFIFNLVLFAIFNAMMIARYTLNPSKIRSSLTAAPECFFYGSWWLTIATIIMCMQKFGVPHTGPWLIVAIRILFWMYAACTLLSTTIMFAVMGKLTKNPAIGRNPGILLTVFHAMLTGTIAAAIAEGQPPHQRLPIMVAGVGFQGYGWTMSVMYMAHIVCVILEKGWPAINVRPGIFMLVGTSGFTIVVLIGVARACPTDYAYFATHPMAPEILIVVATWVGIFLWIFTLWAFGVALFTTLAEMFSRQQTGLFKTNMTFNNVWWAFIFPNVGLTLATVYIGQELESNAIIWTSTAMVIALTTMWLVDMCLMTKVIVVSLFWDSRVKLS